MSKELKRFIASLEGGYVEVIEARDYDALLAERDNYKAWYGDALDASNIAGFAGMTAAQVISHQSEENAQLAAERDALKKDAERLDRLDIECEAYGCEGIHEGNRWMIDGPFRTVRDAIDAALQGEQP